jgi:hypothetical protein
VKLPRPFPKLTVAGGRAGGGRRGRHHLARSPGSITWLDHLARSPGSITWLAGARLSERVWTNLLLIVPIGGLVVLGYSLQSYFVR